MTGLDSLHLLKALMNARSIRDVTVLLDQLPVVSAEQYHWDYDDRVVGEWRPGHLHWLPVGLDRGNGGRIRLAGEPLNPIAERLVNGMEALIELRRTRQLSLSPGATAPRNPREAAQRYFDLLPLDQIERLAPDRASALRDVRDQVRKLLAIYLDYDKVAGEFAVTVRDKGIGQTPAKLHRTLLSLGNSDKPEKPYLIGLFGQGGSSTFMAAQYSIVLSRRAPDVLGQGEGDGVGWSIVRQIFPEGRRDPYFAYLAAEDNGAVPFFSGPVADASNFVHGSQLTHIGYDFGGSSGAITRTMYQGLNHVLFNPILPYELYAMKDTPDPMYGTAQRLARQARMAAQSDERKAVMDKAFYGRAIS